MYRILEHWREMQQRKQSHKAISQLTSPLLVLPPPPLPTISSLFRPPLLVLPSSPRSAVFPALVCAVCVVLVVVAVVDDRLCARVCMKRDRKEEGQRGREPFRRFAFLLSSRVKRRCAWMHQPPNYQSCSSISWLTSLVNSNNPMTPDSCGKIFGRTMLPSCSRSSIERITIVKSENSIWIHRIETWSDLVLLCSFPKDSPTSSYTASGLLLSSQFGWRQGVTSSIMTGTGRSQKT